MSVKYKCTICETHTHFTFQCYRKPKKPIVSHSEPLRRSKPRQHGKHSKLWDKTRSEWFKINKSEHYVCYLCARLMDRRNTQLDHVESRARRPDLRYDLNNLKPVCAVCNRDKGGMSLNRYLAMQEELKRA